MQKRRGTTLASASGYAAFATVFIAQQGIKKYNGAIAVMDIITINQGALLVPIGLTIPQFLAIYKASNTLPFLPTPTVHCNFQNAIEQINGVSYNPPIEELYWR